MAKAILIEDIKDIKGNDRFKNELLRAAEKGIVKTIDVPEQEPTIQTKQLFVGKKKSATKKNADK